MRGELLDGRDVVRTQQVRQHQGGAEGIGEGIVRAGDDNPVASSHIFEFVRVDPFWVECARHF